jgi:hypothetical protein
MFSYLEYLYLLVNVSYFMHICTLTVSSGSASLDGVWYYVNVYIKKYTPTPKFFHYLLHKSLHIPDKIHSSTVNKNSGADTLVATYSHSTVELVLLYHPECRLVIQAGARLENKRQHEATLISLALCESSRFLCPTKMAAPLPTTTVPPTSSLSWNPSHPPADGPVRVLAIDGAPGGAVRGYAQIKIVRALMEMIWKKNHPRKDVVEKEVDAMRPCDHFVSCIICLINEAL